MQFKNSHFREQRHHQYWGSARFNPQEEPGGGVFGAPRPARHTNPEYQNST
jgi:hypothetical protein